MNFTWQKTTDSEKQLLGVIRILVGDDPRLLQFLFDPIQPRLRRRAGILKEDSWNFSHGEQGIIRAALDIWSGSGHLLLWEMLETWDHVNWIRFLNALIALKGFSGQVAESSPSRRLVRRDSLS